MAIEQLGESLLSDIRTRNAQAAKKARKQEEKNALLGLGVNLLGKIGNQVLSDKMTNFLNNEQVLAANVQQKAALRNSTNIYQLQKNIQDSGLSEEDYFMSQGSSLFDARAKAQLGIDIVGPAGPYESVKEKTLREIASEQAKAYRNALEAAGKIADQEDFESAVALNAKKARPSNLGNYVTNKISSFFTGKTKEEVEQEALAAITEGPMSENAEKLNVFMDEFNRTKDLVGSFDFANFVVPEPTSEDALFQIKEAVTHKEIGGAVYEVTTTTKTNRNNGDSKTEETVKEIASTEAGLGTTSAKAFSTIFNYGKDGRDELTTDAFAQFAREAKDLNIRPEAPLSLEQFTTLGNIYSKYTDDPQNLRDQFRQDQILNLQGVLISDAEELKAMVAGLEDDPVKRNQLVQVLRFRLAELMNLSESMVTGRTNYVEMQ